MAKLFCDYNKRWPILAHHSMFPYSEGMAPGKMSYDMWLPVIMQRAPRRQFAQQPNNMSSTNIRFVLDMFNITQRHAVSRAAKHVLQNNPLLLREFVGMEREQLKLAVELFATKLRGTAYSEALAAAPVVVQKFLKQLKRIGNRARATPAAAASPAAAAGVSPLLHGMPHALSPCFRRSTP